MGHTGTVQSLSACTTVHFTFLSFTQIEAFFS